MEVRWTGNRGWGVFTKTPVRKGAYVATYKGEVLSAAAAKERYDAVTSRGGNPDYQGACLRVGICVCTVGWVGRCCCCGVGLTCLLPLFPRPHNH